VSIPSFSLPSGVSLSIPTANPTSFSFPTAVPSSISATFEISVSTGGVASEDGATTYFVEFIEGINGTTNTITGKLTLDVV
jgi:hypothetical protein